MGRLTMLGLVLILAGASRAPEDFGVPFEVRILSAIVLRGTPPLMRNTPLRAV